jgi:hypothetical protein
MKTAIMERFGKEPFDSEEPASGNSYKRFFVRLNKVDKKLSEEEIKNKIEYSLFHSRHVATRVYELTHPDRRSEENQALPPVSVPKSGYYLDIDVRGFYRSEEKGNRFCMLEVSDEWDSRVAMDLHGRKMGQRDADVSRVDWTDARAMEEAIRLIDGAPRW